jgi:hypothetical protein
MAVGSFLQNHYNKWRAMGGDHAEYVVSNEIDDDEKLCEELKKNFEANHPPVSKKAKAALKKKQKEEAERASRIHNLEWLTGTGPYGQ